MPDFDDEDPDEETEVELCAFCQVKKYHKECLTCNDQVCKSCLDYGLCPDCAVDGY